MFTVTYTRGGIMWIFFATGAMLAATWDTIVMSSKKVVAFPVLYRTLAMQMSLIVMIFLLVFKGFPEVSSKFWMFFLVDVFLMFFAQIWHSRALEMGALSQTQSIMALTPMLLLVTDPFFTGESVPILGWIGVALVSVGVYATQHPGGTVDQSGLQWFLAPFKEMYYQKGVRYKLGVALIYTVTSSLDKVCVTESSPEFYIVMEGLFLSFIYTTFILFRSSVQEKKQVKKMLKSGDANVLVFGGLLNAATVFMQFTALTYIATPYVLGVKRLSIVFTSAWSFFYRKDNQFNWWKGAGIIMAVTGVIMMIFSK